MPKAGHNPKPEIMVPVVSTARELRLIVPRIQKAVGEELKAAGVEVSGWTNNKKGTWYTVYIY